MVTRRDFYLDLIDDAARDPSISLEQMFKTLFQDVDARIVEQEDKVLEIEKIKQNIFLAVLEYNQSALEPEFERIRELADLGLLFEGHSASSLEIGVGQKTLVIDEADRTRFTPAGYVGLIRSGDPGHAMTGARASYDRESGTLVVDVDRVIGSGTFADWTVVATSATDNAQAAVDAASHAAAALQHKTDAEAARDTAQAHRDNALIYRDAAEDARDAAIAAQTAAEAAETAAESHLTGVQTVAQRYIGPAAADPTTRPGGGALAAGDLYWNTASGEMRVYSGSAWVVAYIPTGSSVSSFNSRTGAVLPADADYDAAKIVVSPTVAGQNRVQAALAALDTAIGTKLAAAAVSAFGLTLVDDADAATARTTLGAAAASHAHAWGDITSGVPGTISALAGGTAAADKVWYYTGTAAGAFMTVTSFARTLLDDADASTALATLGAAASGHTHSVATGVASGFMSSTDKAKLDGIETGANNYVHPTGDGFLHVPATGTSNNGKVLKAGASAGVFAWATVAYSELTGIPSALDAIDGLTPAADRIAYYTGASSAALTTLSAFARTILDDADAATVRATINAADAGHTHTIANVIGLQTALDAKAPLTQPLLDQPRFTRNYDVTGTDLNTLTTAGQYNGQTLTNSPDGGSGWWHVQVYRYSADANWCVQVAQALTAEASTAFYIRSRLNGTWGSWNRMAAASDLSAYAAASHTHDDRYYTEAEVNSLLAQKLDATAITQVNSQIFNTSGIWTKPSGYDADCLVLIRVWGAGGSGARSSGSANERSGGGGGGYAERWCRLGQLGATETVTIGLGGAARTTNSAGAAGGNTTFGAWATGYGGAGGLAGSNSSGGGGGGWMSAASGATGGLGVAGSGSDLMFAGADGTSSNGGNGYYGGGAGGGAGAASSGGNSVYGGAGGSSRGAPGGTSVFGGNGGGGAALDGAQPGGGGGGDAVTSGKGGDGRCEVHVFPN